MMVSRLVFVLLSCCAFNGIFGLSTIKLNHPKFQCEIICNRAGAKNDYNETTKVCKCLLDNKIDGTDMALLQKYSTIIKGLNAPLIEPVGHSAVIIKREITDDATTAVPTELPTEKMTPLPETTEIPTTTESIVGQKFSLKKLHERLVGQRRREPKPITQEQQKRILQQMRDHITRLGIINDQRGRQLEIDGLRANLKQLSESVIIQVPTQRSRLRAVAEEARKRTLRPRLTPHSRLVGAAQPQTETSTLKDLSEQQEDVESAVKEIKRIHPHFEVITQNPNLIDE